MSFENQKQEEEKFQEKENKKIKPKRSLINKKSIVILIVASLIAISLMFNYAGTVLDKKSRAYADIAIPAIITSWNFQELISRAGPELFKEAPKEKVELSFEYCSDNLGQLQEYKISEGKAVMYLEATCQQGVLCLTPTASYTVEAVFEKGSAIIKIGMFLRSNEWEIIRFSIMADTFLES